MINSHKNASTGQRRHISNTHTHYISASFVAHVRFHHAYASCVGLLLHADRWEIRNNNSIWLFPCEMKNPCRLMNHHSFCISFSRLVLSVVCNKYNNKYASATKYSACLFHSFRRSCAQPLNGVRCAKCARISLYIWYIVEGKNERKKICLGQNPLLTYRFPAHSWSIYGHACADVRAYGFDDTSWEANTLAKNENKENPMANRTRHIHIRRSWALVRTKSPPRLSCNNKISKQDIELWIQNNHRKMMKGMMRLYTTRNNNIIIILSFINVQCECSVVSCNTRRTERKYSRTASMRSAIRTINADFRVLCGFQRFGCASTAHQSRFVISIKTDKVVPRFIALYFSRFMRNVFCGIHRMHVTSHNP